MNGKGMLEVRNKLGLTKEQFGRKLGDFTRVDVAGWEADSKKIPDEILNKIKSIDLK